MSATVPHADHRIARLCGIDYPIFQAGMAGLAGPPLVAAVSQAGGMGIVGGLRVAPRLLRQWIWQTRELTNRPIGVNLVPQFGGAAVFEAQLQVVLQEKPRLLSLFYAEDYPEAICRAKDAGMVVMVQVGTLALAREALARGADILVAQGSEAGGHLHPGKIALSVILPAMCALAGAVPVVAAGAITHRHDVRVAKALGAAGVMAGTAFVATHESSAHPLYKQRIVEATADDTEYRTGYSFGWTYGTPHRVIPNRERYNPLRLMGGGARAVDHPRMARKLSLYAGQGVGKIDRIVSAAERFEELRKGLPVHEALPVCAPHNSWDCGTQLMPADVS
jgi:enoyl-[acyl-carrier protein] reductase II